MAHGTPHRPFTVDPSGPLPQVAAEIQVLCKNLLPGWMGLHRHAMQVSPMQGGLTNVLFKVNPMGYVSDQPLPPVVVRIHGRNSEVFVNRPAELLLMGQLNREGFGAVVLGTFNNGRVETYIQGETLTHKDLQTLHLRNRVARRLQKLHSCTKYERIPKTPQLWHMFERNLKLIDDAYPTLALMVEAGGRDELVEVNTAKFREEVSGMQTVCATVHSPVVFCHNDLTAGNIMYDKLKQMNHEDGLYFIDFEYASYGYRGFDIANHFNEYVGEEWNWSLYPSEEMQKEFFTSYLGTKDDPEGVDGIKKIRDVNETELEAMLVEVAVFSLASHLYWAAWGMLQAKYSTIKGFDFMGYSKTRLAAYYRDKDKAIAMLERIPKPAALQDELD